MNSLILIEAFAVAAAGALLFARPHLFSGTFRAVERLLRRLAQRRRLSALIVGLLALAGRAAMLPIVGVRPPEVHDEFSYVLAADTFASGRLTNPTHPMWVHFETFHVNHQPTYMSMYPPAQGLILAMGTAIGGHPWFGVWLSVGLMCALLCWMLQAWLPPQWALLGGLLAVLRLGVFSYWATSYWGGAHAAIGGALVLGALPRIMRLQRLRDSVLMGLGLAILANSRPYEGFVLSLPVAGVLLFWMTGRRRPPMGVLLRRVLTPTLLLLVMAAATTGYYNWRLCGHPLRLPIQVNRDRYAVAPYFVWQSPKPEPVYFHEPIRNFYVNVELPIYSAFRTPQGFGIATFVKGVVLWSFFLGPALTLPLLSLRRLLWDRRTRFLLVTVCMVLLGLALEVFYTVPHYAAPMTGAVYGVFLQGIRYLRVWRCRGRRVGLGLARMVPLICVGMAILRVGAGPLGIPTDGMWTWFKTTTRNLPRERVLTQLQAAEGRHLVIVRYGPKHEPEQEWVYNEADIDGARIVWAREMDPSRNRRLIRYFKHRRAWLLEPDKDPVSLSPYRQDLNWTDP